METETDSEPEVNKRASFGGILNYFSIVMAVVYVAVGLGIMYNPNDIFRRIPQQYAIAMGLFMIAYGIFRGFRVVQKIISK